MISTKNAYIAKYGICKELLHFYELHPDIPSLTDPQIEPSSISSINISSPTLLDPEFQEESFLTLNISNNEEEVAEIEPDSDNEETIMDYSASNIENKDNEEFKHIDNLDNSFG
ncbi:3846_t:CDS:2 [Dentiscutata heterogama]|uniref:3846_t:CDS:1 n=1 Tax=Dentiscutata heterogama TaxID=1316150 RepID=A0ACA9MTI8_9GLOM|nr:3846_t:CDS:2 [Dentiscutata heterogama]